MNENKCELKNVNEAGMPVHEHQDGTWWFWDATWASEYGPYENYTLACFALADYMCYI